MYCIYQIDGKLNKQINYIVESEVEFYNKVTDLLTSTEYIDSTKYSIVEDTSINHIKLSSCYCEGIYLVKNYRCIQLIKKYKCVTRRCFRDIVFYGINILFTWKLLDFDPKNYDPIKIV